MKPIPMFGSGVYGKSAVVTRQRRVNCYYENRPDGDKSKIVVYGTPGMQLKFTAASAVASAIRGLSSVGHSNLYAVIYNQFLSLGSNGAALFAGLIGTVNGLVSMAANPSGSQILIVDGSAGYVYQPGAGTLTPAPNSSWFVAGASTCTNVGGYFVTEIPGTAEFAVSNLNDATAGFALSFLSAAAFPDVAVAADTDGAGNLVTFCQRHFEVWQPVGSPPPGQPFQPIQSAAAQWGLPAVFARVQADNALFFLGETVQGVRRVCRLQNYVATPISDEIDAVINTTGFYYADATMLTYMRDKHAFVQLTFPTMNRSFLYDCSTGIWNETQSGLTSSAPYARHLANLSVYYNGDTLLADSSTPNLYRMDDGVFTDNGQTILREVVTRHTTRGFNRFRVPQLYLDMETGVGISGQPGAQGVQPMISIEVSKDNGRTWYTPRLVPIGAQGQYKVRVNARRFGQARVFTWRFRMTDPVKFVITDGAIRTKGRMETA